jgi:hypothetical protein
MKLRTFAPAALLLLFPVTRSVAGTHVGNIILRTADDASPAVTLDPSVAPRLALWTCGQNTPTILTGTVESSQAVFALDSDIGTVCKVGIDLGSPVDLRVAGVYTATASPVPESFTVDPIDVEDLAGATLRAGTSTLLTNLRAIAAVPRTATNTEQAAMEPHLSVVTLHLP